MIPLLKGLFTKETAFLRLARAAILVLGAGLSMGEFRWEHLVLGAAGLLGAGEMNKQ